MKHLFKGNYWLIICHFCLFFVAFYLLYLCNIIHAMPGEGNISQWDAGWYASIVQSGYTFVEGKACNLAFFPLFPLVWKATGLSVYGVSILNLVLLMISSGLLVYAFKLSRRETLLLLSMPSMFFCFVPYSESVFFLSASILLVGLHKEKLWLTLLGVFLASTARSASLIFLPILIFLAILFYASSKQKVREFFLVGLGSLVGSLAVFLLQFAQTGKFVEVFKVQTYWNRVLQWPEFPITTWDRFRLVWLDGLAFLAGVFAVVLCCVWLWKRYRKTLGNLDSAFNVV